MEINRVAVIGEGGMGRGLCIVLAKSGLEVLWKGLRERLLKKSMDRLKENIEEHNLNRIVVAACSPRTHEPLFQETLQEAGLNKYLFEMANIRDQCSWVHMKEPEEATAKAKDSVRMAVAKAGLIMPLKRPTLENTPTALVIGGGIAGMTAALNLAD